MLLYISYPSVIQHFTKVDGCQKAIEVTAVCNKDIRPVSTERLCFLPYFIVVHACGFPQGITQCISVLQYFIICLIRMLTFRTYLGSSVIKHFKTELL